jgi:nitrite reductase/ring-hydroxylating ferredoxin subunit
LTWHEACRFDELAAVGAKEVLVAGQVIAVFLVDDELRAVDGMCAHQGGPIAQGELSGNCVTCPWHGWQYDVRNGENLLTGKQMLTTFRVEQRDDSVWIEVPE